MSNRPPNIAEKLLSKLLYDDVWKTTLGDFEERYAYLLEKEGKASANRWYWSQVLRYAPSKLSHKFYWTVGMFFNYLKISLRNLRTNKSYSFINISGLAIGLASFLLIGLFVHHELSYEKHFEDSDRIYRVIKQNANSHEGKNWYDLTPIPLHIGLKDNFPQFEHTTYASPYTGLIKLDENSFYEKGLYAGGEFFETFRYTWLQGTPATALNDPASIILTRSLAKKIFGNENPIGETLDIIPEYETEPSVKMITGVIEDLPTTSHLYFNYVTNETSSIWHEGNADHWDSNGYFTFAKLGENSVLNDELFNKIDTYYNSQMQDMAYYKSQPDQVPRLAFQPLEDIHLKSTHINHNYGITLGDIKYVYTLALIGLIILLIACVNYMNLATARAIMRAKEVGVRKVIGALRSNLIMQFISEAVLLSLFSILMAVVLVWMFFPSFVNLVNRSIDIDFFTTIEFWISVLGISLVVGVLAGSYPAFYMSRLQPSGIFKNHTKGGKGNAFMRNALVTGQFAITTILIIGSIVIFQQLNFIRTTDVGYTRDQILTVPLNDDNFGARYDAVAQSLKSNPNILSVSSGAHLPMDIPGSTSGVNWTGREERVKFYRQNVHYDFLEMMDIELVAGRYFSKEYSTDETEAFIINESAAAGMGFTPEEVLGTRLEMWQREGDVIGVVKDFNFLSFRLEQAALMIGFNRDQDYNYLVMKIRPENMEETISFVEKTVTEASPDYPFEYAFMDDAFDNIYKTDLNLGTLLNAFTILALFIASIGLFGLASFMMEQRAKEIGIRKVLGANLVQILALVNKDFMKLIGLSFVIAIPVGWYAMNGWLQDFAYKINLGPSIFISAVGLAVFIALLTVSFKSLKTATANPVNSLKSE
ncbi:MAG: ABC transporter permease [Balneolaceae bacterium]